MRFRPNCHPLNGYYGPLVHHMPISFFMSGRIVTSNQNTGTHHRGQRNDSDQCVPDRIQLLPCTHSGYRMRSVVQSMGLNGSGKSNILDVFRAWDYEYVTGACAVYSTALWWSCPFSCAHKINKTSSTSEAKQASPKRASPSCSTSPIVNGVQWGWSTSSKSQSLVRFDIRFVIVFHLMVTRRPRFPTYPSHSSTVTSLPPKLSRTSSRASNSISTTPTSSSCKAALPRCISITLSYTSPLHTLPRSSTRAHKRSSAWSRRLPAPACSKTSRSKQRKP